ncbi:MAG: hypothetical protein KIT44_01785 [Opitutaceae bacterium]|nr:hypothetical protein [Opitutaceae bacterium]
MPPLWPDAAAEEAYLAEQRTAQPVPPARPAAVTEEAPEPPGPLPPLETLLPRIPPAVREALDEHFRAKFVKVQRVPRAALNAAGSGSDRPM